MDLFDFDIDRVAHALINHSKLFNCSLEEAWETHLHHSLKENAAFCEVKDYIENIES